MFLSLLLFLLHNDIYLSSIYPCVYLSKILVSKEENKIKCLLWDHHSAFTGPSEQACEVGKITSLSWMRMLRHTELT